MSGLFCIYGAIQRLVPKYVHVKNVNNDTITTVEKNIVTLCMHLYFTKCKDGFERHMNDNITSSFFT